MNEIDNKKYASLNNLQIFLDNLKTIFSDISHTHTIDEITDFPDVEAFIYEAIYGFVDGTIETVTNDKATYVRDYAFYQHQNLINAVFSKAESIGNYSFYKCPELALADILSATNIGKFAFKGCPSLTSANYPLATVVGEGAFDECITLDSVNLSKLQAVKPLTFRKCKSLTAVDLPVVTSIGTQAFYDSDITSLTLRSNTMVALENEDAFYFTPIEEGVGHIYVPSNLVDSYKAADGWSAYANQIVSIG